MTPRIITWLDEHINLLFLGSAAVCVFVAAVLIVLHFVGLFDVGVPVP